METISTQARGCLNFFVSNPHLRINYRILMTEHGVSKRRSLAILKELREANYLKIVKLAGGGTNVKLVTSDVPTVGTSGNSYTASSAISNSYTASKVNKATNKFLDDIEGEESDVGYEWFDKMSSGEKDDIARERDKHVAYKKAEYAEARELKAQRRKDLHRSNLDPVHWTCKDVAYEFADRMANIWTIAPFSVTQSRFVQALAVFRKQHDTDGAIEMKIVELFFATLKQDKYTDGNHLWRAFLYKAPSLIQVARESIVSAEEREHTVIRDQELAERKLSMFDED